MQYDAIPEQMWPDKKQGSIPFCHLFRFVRAQPCKTGLQILRDYRSHATGFCPARPCHAPVDSGKVHGKQIGCIDSPNPVILESLGIFLIPSPCNFGLSSPNISSSNAGTKASGSKNLNHTKTHRVPAWFWPAHTLTDPAMKDSG